MATVEAAAPERTDEMTTNNLLRTPEFQALARQMHTHPKMFADPEFFDECVRNALQRILARIPEPRETIYIVLADEQSRRGA